MVDNPYEPKPPPSFEAGPRVLARRGNAYQLPPIGGCRGSRAHHVRQERIGMLMMLGIVVLPLGWWFGTVFGWWNW
jgi:hypothetical protein